MKSPCVYIALLHYPMYNKRMDTITTSVTNLDLHDIARAARTYGIKGYYVVHPSENQQRLIARIIGYWQNGFGGEYNPDRQEAFDILRPVKTLSDAVENITLIEGKRPVTVATDARIYGNTIDYASLRTIINETVDPYLILFGTGWGMTRELIESCDHVLRPLAPASDYNHLSVRSASSIIMDRLMGEQWL